MLGSSTASAARSIASAASADVAASSPACTTSTSAAMPCTVGAPISCASVSEPLGNENSWTSLAITRVARSECPPMSKNSSLHEISSFGARSISAQISKTAVSVGVAGRTKGGPASSSSNAARRLASGDVDRGSSLRSIFPCEQGTSANRLTRLPSEGCTDRGANAAAARVGVLPRLWRRPAALRAR